LHFVKEAQSILAFTRSREKQAECERQKLRSISDHYFSSVVKESSGFLTKSTVRTRRIRSDSAFQFRSVMLAAGMSTGC
jgi:hypothetical protein